MNPSAIEGLNEATAEALASPQGDKYGASFAAAEGTTSDWLISPELSLGDDPMIEFLARSYTTNYGA